MKSEKLILMAPGRKIANAILIYLFHFKKKQITIIYLFQVSSLNPFYVGITEKHRLSNLFLVINDSTVYFDIFIKTWNISYSN